MTASQAEKPTTPSQNLRFARHSSLEACPLSTGSVLRPDRPPAKARGSGPFFEQGPTASRASDHDRQLLVAQAIDEALAACR